MAVVRRTPLSTVAPPCRQPYTGPKAARLRAVPLHVQSGGGAAALRASPVRRRCTRLRGPDARRTRRRCPGRSLRTVISAAVGLVDQRRTQRGDSGRALAWANISKLIADRGGPRHSKASPRELARLAVRPGACRRQSSQRHQRPGGPRRAEDGGTPCPHPQRSGVDSPT